MTDTTILTGTLVLPAYADLSFASAIAGVVLPPFADVSTRLAVLLDATTTLESIDDDVATVTLIRTNGWGRLNQQLASALAVCGVHGWVMGDDDAIIELVDGTAISAVLSDGVSAFDVLTT